MPGNRVVTRDPSSPVAHQLEEFVEEEIDGMTRGDKEKLEKQRAQSYGEPTSGGGVQQEEEDEEEDDDDDEDDEDDEDE